MMNMIMRGMRRNKSYTLRTAVNRVLNEKNTLGDMEKLEIEDSIDTSFEALGLSESTIKVLKNKGFNALFPVQSATFKIAFDGKDIIARERTGSGKTVAYSLPLLERLRHDGLLGKGVEHYPKILVMVPTRELCVQVTREIESLKHYPDEFRVASLFGGTEIGAQLRLLQRGADVLVATPGRLHDHMGRGTVDLAEISKIVLDETDEMLNIGFKEKITEIIDEIKAATVGKSVQYLLFSATIPPWVKATAKQTMNNNAVFVDLVKNDEIKTSMSVKHVRIPKKSEEHLPEMICGLIETYAGELGRTIVFTNTKVEANKIAMEGGIAASTDVLHGDIPQVRRQKTFDDFRSGIVKCLVATNVAARGLDFPNVDLVIQVGTPQDVESYIHRSGRTGRAGNDGVCVTVYNRYDIDMMREIEIKAGISFEDVVSLRPEEILAKKAEKLREQVITVQEEAAETFRSIAKEMIATYGPEEALSRTVAVYLGYVQKHKEKSVWKDKDSMITVKVEMRNVERFRNVSEAKSELASGPLSSLLEEAIDFALLNDNNALIFNIDTKHLPAINAIAYEHVNLKISYPAFIPRMTYDNSRYDNSRQDNSRQGYNRFDNDRRQSSHSQSSFLNEDRNRQPRTPTLSSLNNSIFVSGISSGMSEEDVRSILSQEGIKIKNVYILKNRESGRPIDKALLTPQSTKDYNDIIALKTIQTDDSVLSFKHNSPIGR